VVGSSSSFPLRRWLSVASEDPRSGELGACPWSMGDCRWLHPVLRGGCFNSSQSRWAMGLLQTSVVFIILSGGGCRRWGCRAASASTSPRGLIVIFAFLGSFVQFGRCSSLCIFFILSVCVRTFVRSLSSNIDMYFQKKCRMNSGLFRRITTYSCCLLALCARVWAISFASLCI
jgi:hypothetical protein